MIEEIKKRLKEKIKDTGGDTDKYQYRCGLHDSFKIIEQYKCPSYKIAVFKDGTHEFLNNIDQYSGKGRQDYLTTISINL